MNFLHRIWSYIVEMFRAPAPVVTPAPVVEPEKIAPKVEVKVVPPAPVAPMGVTHQDPATQAPFSYNLIQHLFDIHRQGEFSMIVAYYMAGDTPADTVARHDAAVAAPVVPRQNDLEARSVVNHGFRRCEQLSDNDKMALQARMRTDPHFAFRVLSGTVGQINDVIQFGGSTHAGEVGSFDLGAYNGVLKPYM
jgi:hypothetical protein